MPADRQNDILSNLEFAFDTNRELSILISNAQRDDSFVKHISQKSASILSSLRECFDYCISDIKDDFLPNEKRRVYYPFHKNMLIGNAPLNELSNSNPPLYKVLTDIVNAIESASIISGTMCSYADLRAINDLVNLKKHNRVLEVCEQERSRTRITYPNEQSMTVSPIVPIGANGLPDFTKSGQVGSEAWTSSSDVQIKAVKNFHFDNTDVNMSRTDVHGFCMTAITSTRFVLSDVYHVAYSTPEDIFKAK